MKKILLAVTFMLPTVAQSAIITIEDTFHGFVTDTYLGTAYVPGSWVSVGDKVILDFVAVYDDTQEDMLYSLNQTFQIIGDNYFTYQSHLNGPTSFDPITLDFHDSGYDVAQMLWQGVQPEYIPPGDWLEEGTTAQLIVGNLRGEIHGWDLVGGSVYDDMHNLISYSGDYAYDYSVSPIPEPATGLLYGAGLLGLCYASRKGRRSPRRYAA